MARNKGTFPFAANFEVKAASPLDPRVLVEKKAELISKDTWPLDGDTLYIYKGLLVSVQQESAIYMLVDPDKILAEDYSGWERKDGNSPGEVSYEDIYIIEGLTAQDIYMFEEGTLNINGRSLSEAINSNKRVYIKYSNNAGKAGIIPCSAYKEDVYYVSFCMGSSLYGFDISADSQYIDETSIWHIDVQEKLESGINIKTINGNDIVGSGDIKIEGLPSAIPDWNENNPNAASYIKNRTHYKVEDISYGTSTGYGDHYHDDDDTPITPNRIRVRSEEWFISDWISVYDGYSEYFEELYLYDEYGNIQDTYSGNITVDMYTSGVELDMGSSVYYVDLDYSTIKKLSEEFIPDTIARKSDLENIGGGGSVDSEEITEIKTTLDSHNELIEDLQNMKIDKENDDYYPNMSVGVADNLSGVDVVASEFTSRQSGGGAILDGTARIEAIKGNSIVWNQKLIAVDRITGGGYVDNNFNVDTNGSHSILTFISDAKFELSGNSSRADYTLGEIVIPEHKYLFCCDIKTLCDAIQVGIGNYNYDRIPVTPGEFCRISAFRTVSSLDTYIYQKAILYFLANPFDIKAGQTIEIKNVAVYDLTKMFGAGNEPTTVEEFNKRIPIGVDPMLYNEGQMINLNPSGIRSTNKEEDIDRVQDLSIVGELFPDGMKSVGEFHDEIRYNKETQKWEKIVWIGAKAYQDGDADNAEYVTDGQITYYILKQPIVEELEFDGNLDYQVWNGGTEELVADHPCSALKADIAYGFNAYGKIKELEEKINSGGGGGVSKEYVDGKLTELSAEVGKKQNTITDLETIREGASKGATAIQEVKTINGQSIVGKGDITIQGGGGGVSNEWKCVVDRRLLEGEKNLIFTTYADGTPLKATELMVQLLNDKKSAQNITGYVGIKSTNNQNETIYGSLTYEMTSADESNQRLHQMRICASPFFTIAEYAPDIKCTVASSTYALYQGGNLKTFQIYEDIVYVKIAPNAALTSAAPYLKVYAR